MEVTLRFDVDDHGPVVFLTGNLSEGFEAHGPYGSMDEACDVHTGDEGWLMTLNMDKMLKNIPNHNTIPFPIKKKN